MTQQNSKMNSVSSSSLGQEKLRHEVLRKLLAKGNITDKSTNIDCQVTENDQPKIEFLDLGQEKLRHEVSRKLLAKGNITDKSTNIDCQVTENDQPKIEFLDLCQEKLKHEVLRKLLAKGNITDKSTNIDCQVTENDQPKIEFLDLGQEKLRHEVLRKLLAKGNITDKSTNIDCQVMENDQPKIEFLDLGQEKLKHEVLRKLLAKGNITDKSTNIDCQVTENDQPKIEFLVDSNGELCYIHLPGFCCSGDCVKLHMISALLKLWLKLTYGIQPILLLQSQKIFEYMFAYKSNMFRVLVDGNNTIQVANETKKIMKFIDVSDLKIRHVEADSTSAMCNDKKVFSIISSYFATLNCNFLNN